MKKFYFMFFVALLSVTNLMAQDLIYYGVWTDNPAIYNKWSVDDAGRHLYIWEGTLAQTGVDPAVSWGNPLGFTGLVEGWWGFGLFDDNGANISAFAEGILTFYIASTHNETIEIIVSDRTDVEQKWFLSTNDFPRDGEWHLIELPISDVVAAGVNLNNIGHVFAGVGGGQPGLIAFDEIYYVVEAEVSNSIDKNEVASSFNVFPNPAIDNMTISLGIETNAVSVLDMLGNVVYTQNNMAGKSNLDINVSAWGSGIYFVVVTDVDGKQGAQKVVVK